MKSLLGGLALSVLVALPATAADLRRPMPVKAPPAPVATLYSWTGCYIGVHGGWAWGKKRLDDPITSPSFDVDFSHDVDGFLVGGQVGCNLWQNDRWVLGVEGQVAWADIDGDIGPFMEFPTGTNSFRTEADVIGSIAARLGYAFGANGQGLLFVKGGAAFIREQFFSFNHRETTFDMQSDKDWRWGWMVGAGIEWVLVTNWTIKAEYNYNHFGSRDVPLCSSLAGVCSTWGIKQDVHLVKVGLNWRFSGFGGPVAPVAARY